MLPIELNDLCKCCGWPIHQHELRFAMIGPILLCPLKPDSIAAPEPIRVYDKEWMAGAGRKRGKKE